MSYFYSVERAFDKLVDDMISFDLAIRAVVENAELLVFSSTLLPIQCRSESPLYFLLLSMTHFKFIVRK